MIGATGGYRAPHPDAIRPRTEAQRYAQREFGTPTLAWMRSPIRSSVGRGSGLRGWLSSLVREAVDGLMPKTRAGNGRRARAATRLSMSSRLTTAAMVLPVLAAERVEGSLRPRP